MKAQEPASRVARKGPIRRLSIRTQVFALAIVPAIVIAGLVTLFSVLSRFDELDSALFERGNAVARRLGVAAEYPVFSGDTQALHSLAASALADADVTAVTFVANDGRILGSAGSAQIDPVTMRPRSASPRAAAEIIVFSAQIAPVDGPTDALFDATVTGLPAAAAPTGHVLVELTRAGLSAKKRQLLLVSVAIMLAGLAVTGLASMRLGRALTRPLLAVTDVVERIGEGDLGARAVPAGGASLERLIEGVNAMAGRLESARDELEGRVAAATAEAIQRKDEAERASLAKSRFLAMASHDLRQPMHALEMFVTELARMEHRPQSQRLIEMVARSSDALGKLLDSLLDISKLDAGVMTPRISRFALAPMLERLERELGPMAGAKGLQLRVVPTRLAIESDPILFERIVRNLMTNAIVYTDDGSVLVGCRRRGAMVRVEVRDSGIGIPAASQQEIFGEFVQLANPERARSKGMGLGLAIVERIAKLLGHTMSLRSAVGRGSLFAVEARRAEAPDATDAATVDVFDSHRLAEITVYVIDDDELVLEGTASLLRSWGCAVHTGDTAAQVIADAGGEAAVAPQLIVCDYRLRDGRNGIDEITKLRARFGGRVAAAIISGDTDASLFALAKAAELPVLSKPVRPMQLRALVQSSRR